MSNATELPEAPRILIVRLSALGDVIHGLPVANAIKKIRPEAKIGWVVDQRFADILEGHKAISHISAIPRRWLRSPSAALRIRRGLLERFDIALDLQGLAKSALIPLLSGIKQRIGFAPPEGREISGWCYTDSVAATAEHVVDKNLQLLSSLGISDINPEFGIHIPHEAAAKTDSFIRENGLESGFAALNPGAGWESKRWPRERFAEVARSLRESRGLPSVVAWGGAEERDWAEEIVRRADGAAIMAPPTNLKELAALLRESRIFVGSDTGPLHMAAAVGVPCVGMFGPMPAERNGAYGTAHVNLQKVRFEGTSRERRNAGPEAMEAITVADVVEACKTILER